MSLLLTDAEIRASWVKACREANRDDEMVGARAVAQAQLAKLSDGERREKLDELIVNYHIEANEAVAGTRKHYPSIVEYHNQIEALFALDKKEERAKYAEELWQLFSRVGLANDVILAIDKERKTLKEKEWKSS
jgi:hypothetical protein